MAYVDLWLRNTIWSYSIPIAILCFIIFLFVTDRIKLIRQWYCDKYLVEFAEAHDELTESIKKALFADLNDLDSNLIDLRNKGLIRILEIGVGSGSNLQYYPQQCRLIVVDPKPYFQEYFRSNFEKFPDIVLEKFVMSSGERLRGIPSCSVDVVVTTAVLCCVQSVPKVLKEIKRVLAPGGHYYFLEHVLASHNTKTWKLQMLANWSGLWKWLHDGCEFRRIDVEIAKAGFSDVDINNFSLDKEVNPDNHNQWISMISPHIVGVATKKNYTT